MPARLAAAALAAVLLLPPAAAAAAASPTPGPLGKCDMTTDPGEHSCEARN